jgi:hypothetical protein
MACGAQSIIIRCHRLQVHATFVCADVCRVSTRMTYSAVNSHLLVSVTILPGFTHACIRAHRNTPTQEQRCNGAFDAGDRISFSHATAGGRGQKRGHQRRSRMTVIVYGRGVGEYGAVRQPPTKSCKIRSQASAS